ncbi:hypothetical protein M899_2615 [Bacteriovorax sp. BSW11_IV]|uniref:DUF6901 family protein n=1 Tax=Bacteriovorax sp. BSW11_IV TaxID=1353529 RepID=UPI00038A1C9B|nr:hypothetical protein [Bacteriovorax sp. BSW11_IV]EQC49893.1 hypothetical protein M899_2615 [Bacteriovorax sp. BSW11_IV]
MSEKPYTYKYKISFANGEVYTKDIVIDNIDGTLVESEIIPKDLEEMARLDFCKCTHCPYSEKEFKYCPVFRNITQVVNDFKNHNPHEVVTASVEFNGRKVETKDELHVPLTSLVGLLMASSECEYFDFLKPMAKTHQPFSTYEETLIRVVSFYFLNRFLCGHTLDWNIQELRKQYQDLEKVNAGILERIKAIKDGAEAEAEAVLVLDSFIKNFSWEYELNLDDLKEFFQRGKGFLNL